MRFGKKFLAVAVVSSLAAPAAAQSFVDSAQFTISGAAYAVGGSSLQRLAQTLHVANSGELAGVYVPIACATGTLEVELRDVDGTGKPGPTVIASASVPAADMDLWGRFMYVALPPVYVFGATDVAVVASNPTGSCGMASGATGYSSGRGYFEALPNPPGWVALGDFPGTPDDLAFQLVLRRPGSTAPARDSFIDASNVAVDTSIFLSVGGRGGYMSAQTMTAEVGGRVDGVFMMLNCSYGDTIVEMRDVVGGEPGSFVYASATLSYPLATPPYQTFGYVPLRTKLELSPGDEVAVVVRRPAGDKGSCSINPSPLKGDYAGGHAFWTDTKGTWHRYSDDPALGDDLPFELVLR